LVVLYGQTLKVKKHLWSAEIQIFSLCLLFPDFNFVYILKKYNIINLKLSTRTFYTS